MAATQIGGTSGFMAGPPRKVRARWIRATFEAVTATISRQRRRVVVAEDRVLFGALGGMALTRPGSLVLLI
jgi:hypothetical protein